MVTTWLTNTNTNAFKREIKSVVMGMYLEWYTTAHSCLWELQGQTASVIKLNEGPAMKSCSKVRSHSFCFEEAHLAREWFYQLAANSCTSLCFRSQFVRLLFPSGGCSCHSCWQKENSWNTKLPATKVQPDFNIPSGYSDIDYTWKRTNTAGYHIYWDGSASFGLHHR